jgi:hypothetical protein
VRGGARLICLLVLLELTVACGSQRPPASPPDCRVTGTVAAGPVSPVARPGEPGTRPVRRATVEALRGRKVVAVARTDRAGHYHLTLPPGTYVILVKAHRYLSRHSSKTVAVSAGQTLKVAFVLDTGIR